MQVDDKLISDISLACGEMLQVIGKFENEVDQQWLNRYTSRAKELCQYIRDYESAVGSPDAASVLASVMFNIIGTIAARNVISNSRR